MSMYKEVQQADRILQNSETPHFGMDYQGKVQILGYLMNSLEIFDSLK